MYNQGKPSCSTATLKSNPNSVTPQPSPSVLGAVQAQKRSPGHSPFPQGSRPPPSRLHGAQQTSQVIASSMAEELYQLDCLKWAREVTLTHKTKNNIRRTRAERGKWDNGTLTGALSRSKWHSARAMGTGRHKEEAKSAAKQGRRGGEESLRHDLGTKYPKQLFSE